MMRLRFYTPDQEASEAMEPGLFFRLVGSMLCRGAENEPVATYHKRWLLMNGEYARAEALDPVVIYFEDNAGRASSAFGPYDSFQIYDGNACSGAKLIAKLDDKTLLWHPPKAADGWASLLIAPPGKSRFDLTERRRAPR
jgi:hypothetical protein